MSMSKANDLELSRRQFGVLAGSLAAAASPTVALQQAAAADRPVGSSTFGRAKPEAAKPAKEEAAKPEGKLPAIVPATEEEEKLGIDFEE
jgi:hypothetical protein